MARIRHSSDYSVALLSDDPDGVFEVHDVTRWVADIERMGLTGGVVSFDVGVALCTGRVVEQLVEIPRPVALLPPPQVAQVEAQSA